MTGRPFTRSRANENDEVDPDPAGKRALQADESMKKGDNDPRSKDAYEPQNKRGTGTDREYPQDDSANSGDNGDIAGGNRGAA